MRDGVSLTFPHFNLPTNTRANFCIFIVSGRLEYKILQISDIFGNLMFEGVVRRPYSGFHSAGPSVIANFS